jgi:aspartate aminotransferase-like enzyme
LISIKNNIVIKKYYICEELEMTQLRIPGPTPLPPEVLQSMTKQMINHRAEEFHGIMKDVSEKLKTIFQTKNDVYTLISSGTGGLEAAIVNFLSPGDPILGVSIGNFGRRFMKIAKAYGADVIPIEFEGGTAADPDKVKQALEEHPEVKAVLITHNETSTGITNDLETLAKIVKSFDKLLIVDCVSSLGSINCPVDKWDIDVAISGSQKGWMAPPGLAFVSVSDKAWEYYEKAKMPRFYFDLGKSKEFLAKNETPWTPAITTIYALKAGLDILIEEGLENIFARHVRVSKLCREGIKSMGLKQVADEKYASNTVTAIWLPDGIEYKALAKAMLDDKDVIITGGQDNLKGKIFRIGHLGWVNDADIEECLNALKYVLPKLGYQIK